MKILHVVPSYLPAVRYGGTIESVHGLCKALAGKGHEVQVFTTNVDGPIDSPVPTSAPVMVDGVAVRYFPSARLRRLFWSPQMERALRDATSDFDIVHTHSIFLWPTWAAARAARRCGVPYVLSTRGMLETDLVRRRSRWAKTVWLGFIERKNLEGATAVHFTSERERREAGRFGYRFRREVVIPNGVDLAPKNEQEGMAVSPTIREALSDSRPYYLFLGRISWKKGLDRLIRALALVPQGRLVVAGNDDEGYWPQMERLIRELGLEDRVSYVGPVRGMNKNQLLKCALALVLPSYSENFGNVVLEAMGAGCPVVVTPEVGAAEIVEREGAGLVVDGDRASLSAALAWMMNSSGMRAAQAIRGQAAAKKLSWVAVAERMTDIYRGLAVVDRKPQ